jgi:flagellar hook-associated protein 3 FlgL
MRITNNMISQQILSNLQRNFQSVATLQQVLSTGRKFRLPEDNPLGVAESLNLRQELAENRRYTRNIDQAETDLQLSETTLGTLTDRLQRARVLAVQASNATLPEESRIGVLQEIEQIFQDYVQLANSNFEGRYLFSGDRTSTSPFEVIGDAEFLEGVRYRGDFEDREIEVAQGERIKANLTGIEAFFTALNEVTSSVGVTPDTLLAPQLAGNVPALTVAAGDFTINGVSIAFDPAVDTLETLRDSINRAGVDADARIDSDGRLIIRSLTSNDVQLANGTSNVLEVLDLFHRVEGTAIGAGLTPASTLAGLGITGDAISILVDDQEYEVDLAGATTLADVIAAVSASGAPVEAFINAAGTGLTFSATQSVESLEVSSLRKIFGSTALAPGTVNGSTTLASLGITAGVIEINNDGAITQVDLSGVTTVAGVVEAINTQVNGVTASINSDGTGLDLESAFFSSSLSAADVGPPVGTDVATVLGFAQTRSQDNAADLGIAGQGEVDEVVSDNMFLTLSKLRTELLKSDPDPNTVDEVLASFDRDLDNLLLNRTDVGSRINRLQSTQERYGAFEVFLTELLSENEDADLAETITHLTTQTNILEGSLAAGAQILRPSLLDFLVPR